MHNVEQRLTKCFSVVFPELSREEIVKSTLNTTGADSLTTVTLMAIVEEEFGIELEPDDLLQDMSFQSITACLIKAMDSDIPEQSAHNLR